MALNKKILDKILLDIEALIPFEERWENLTLANDFMFGTVMNDAELCTEMMRRIFPDMEIDYVSVPEVQVQKSLRGTMDTRSVRFDLYARSSGGHIYDVEVQTRNKKDLPQRTRAYHAMMGLDALRKDVTKHYNDMPDEFVIFICTFDPFGQGRHIYTFRNTCSEDKNIALNDGAFTIFLNTCGTKNDVNPELLAFLDFLTGKETPGDGFIQKLSERLKIAQQDSERRRFFMLEWLNEISKLEDAREEGREEVREEARAAALSSLTSNMKAQGFAEDVIAKLIAAVSSDLQSLGTTGA